MRHWQHPLLIVLTALALAACGSTSQPDSAGAVTEVPGETTTGPAPGQAVADPTAPSIKVEVPPPVDVTTRSITVGGMGAEYAPPVRSVVDIGITCRRATVDVASRDAATAATAMTKALTSSGVAASDIQTTQFSIGPYYMDYPEIAGYETTLGYRVVLRDISTVGSVLGAAVAAGGDDVQAWGVRFEADPSQLIEPARVKAWSDVTARAESLAGLAGEPLGDVLDVHEKVLVSTSQGMYQGGEGDSASFDIPVSPGVTGVTVLLTVTYAIGE